MSFVEKCATDPAFALPFHRAVKKVPFIDLSTGEMVEPAAPNAVKLERFVFDAIGLAESSIVMETDRVEEFAPVKNADGPDSIVTSKLLQTRKAARWLEAVGVTIPRTEDGRPDCVLEIGGLAAIGSEHLDSDTVPATIKRGAEIDI